MKRMLWEIWKDKFISKLPWRMQTPLGILAYQRKRDAIQAKETYEKSIQGR